MLSLPKATPMINNSLNWAWNNYRAKLVNISTNFIMTGMAYLTEGNKTSLMNQTNQNQNPLWKIPCKTWKKNFLKNSTQVFKMRMMMMMVKIIELPKEGVTQCMTRSSRKKFVSLPTNMGLAMQLRSLICPPEKYSIGWKLRTTTCSEKVEKLLIQEWNITSAYGFCGRFGTWFPWPKKSFVKRESRWKHCKGSSTEVRVG